MFVCRGCSTTDFAMLLQSHVGWLMHLSVKVETGNDQTPDNSHTRPTDFLIKNWTRGMPAAFDICIISLLNTLTLSEAGVCSSAVAQDGDLGWVGVSLVAETYGACVPEAMVCFSLPKSDVLYDLYERYTMRLSPCHFKQGSEFLDVSSLSVFVCVFAAYFAGGDVVFHHNRLRGIMGETTCHQVHLSIHLEVGQNLFPDHSNAYSASLQPWTCLSHLHLTHSFY